MLKPVSSILFLFLTYLCFGQAKHVHSNSSDSIKLIKITNYVAEISKKGQFSGTILILKNDSTFFTNSYGKSNFVSNDLNSLQTKYPISSITKMFTALCILKLADEGKLNVNDKLSRFLPSFPNGDKITVYMLLTHTSGLQKNWFLIEEHEYKYFKTKPSEDSVRALLQKEIDFGTKEISRDSVMHLIEKKQLLFTPGSEWNYSNLGYILLGSIIEKASGLSYEAFLQQRILSPYGLTGTGVLSGLNVPGDVAKSYYHSIKTNKLIESDPLNMNLTFAAGDLYSTAPDLIKLGNIIAYSSFLSKANKKLMLTPNKNDCGCGVGLNKLLGFPTIGHGGGYLGMSSQLIIIPRKHLGLVVISNVESDVYAGKIAYDLSELLLKN
jgi:CubicO group peptidase (beta-lactamase class C family)